MKQPYLQWISESPTSSFDSFVIASRHPINLNDVQKAYAFLCTDNSKNVVTDGAMTFMVFLDEGLNTPITRQQIKRQSLERVFAKQRARG